ncbi:hypothetical protein [Mycolicibacterium confluentis]|uniref:Uncharacterized protein n=1 Tax=Mycolicibacterium confluentis TaxID=28047 RepID=A0A7I7Y4M1_9MYCO|nr:hypothetical protein [Mycolicibacterium confluentis]ORV20639.1 hypothetical protein AWB99_06685 [Mycolicibacterium confluentis]BBZ35871.1 hypothetical protein MCNF_44760 [Mycolicibacterium confluentis]
MTGATRDPVDELVGALAPEVPPPAIRRRDVVLVTGPWLAGSSSVVALLRERRPDVEFVESDDLRPGQAPVAVVFVASAVAPLTDSDCAVLDAAAAHTDVVVAAVAKIDAHANWRDVLDEDRRILDAHDERYRGVPWVGVAAAPDLGSPRIDDLLAALDAALLDPSLQRRNRLRAWEFRLIDAARRHREAVESPGRAARVAALQAERTEAARAVRVGKSERAVALRSQIQQARLQLSYFARNRCASVRTELQEDAAEVTRRGVPQFLGYVEQRMSAVVGEVDAGIVEHLTDVAVELGVAPDRVAPARVSVPAVGRPPLKSRGLETRLMVLVGGGFGLGVALSLSRLFADLAPGWTVAGAVVCTLIGVAVAAWMVGTRALLLDRAVIDRWIGERAAALRSSLDEAVATRVLATEMAMTSVLAHQVEVDNARLAADLNRIDVELREHAAARSQAAAARDAALPSVLAALTRVRHELSASGSDEGVAGEQNDAVSVIAAQQGPGR